MPIFGGKKDKKSKAVSTIEDIIDEADTNLKAGDTDKAASEYRRAHRYLYREEDITKDPEAFSELFTRTGHGLFETGEPDRAVECFDKATQLHPQNLDAWMSRGIVHLKTGGMLNYAVMCFDEVLKQESDNEEALENKMESLFASKKEDDAIEILRKLAEIAPDNETYKARLDEISPTTLESITDSLKKNPRDPALWRLRADMLESEGRTAEAIESLLRLAYLEKKPDAYDKVLELNPNNRTAQDKLLEYRPDDISLLERKAAYLEEEGMSEEAMETYQKLAELDPANEMYRSKIGVAKPDELESIEEILAGDPKNTEALFKKARLLDEKGEAEGAMAAFRKLVELAPDNLEYLEGLLKFKPDDIGLLNTKGDLLFDREDYEKALEAFTKVTELTPQDADALHNKGAVLFKLERYEDAVATFDQLIAIDAGDITAYLTKGAAYYKVGKFDESIDALNNVVKRTPDDAAAWFYKSCAEAQRGNDKLVLPFLTRAADIEEEFRERAKTDPAFDSVRDSPEFLAIINK